MTTKKKEKLFPISFSQKLKKTIQKRKGISVWTRIKVKLNSKSDYFKSHKIFGIPCLISYFYHAIVFFINLIFYGVFSFGFENYSKKFLFLILTWHCLLPISSLQFKHILAQRKKKFPGMIWKEMRLQQIAFTLRQYFVAVVRFVVLYACVCVCTVCYISFHF